MDAAANDFETKLKRITNHELWKLYRALRLEQCISYDKPESFRERLDACEGEMKRRGLTDEQIEVLDKQRIEEYNRYCDVLKKVYRQSQRLGWTPVQYEAEIKRLRATGELP